ncbi:hypothetical protein K435DRAFT_323829 [Dendrothele bispora CBS 962.96]|uniref:INO80 complex subunit B-like conserved region domain-containing protein n=1 Tax=Dendrothele bispora (strain CBS 962.96) TaxID=1314807 RepID=A0A4S8LGL3_DENBC|nr:hypothetical protein K435DRAFT_323829 [Dendrothele bispora CBS 962.96]
MGTRAKGATTKRSAAVRSRRRIQDMDSSSEQEDEPESQDEDEAEGGVDVEEGEEGDEDDAEGEGEDEVDIEEDVDGDEDDMDVDGEPGTGVSTPGGGFTGVGGTGGVGAGRRLTARQAVLANVAAGDPVHVSLDLVDVQSLNTAKSKKKVLNETEIALRKEENARKRKKPFRKEARR